LGYLVSRTSSPDVWQALQALLDRADLGMRMELINNLKPPPDAPAEIFRSFHAIYLRYRDDATVRDADSSTKFNGPGAGFPYRRITMRDYIHMHWARWLHLKLKAPGQTGTPEAWKAYREAVGLAIQKHNAEHDVAPDAEKPGR
jgi:hypothetical protein